MPQTFYKILVPGLCTLATFLVASPSAQAGHWERDHYEENGLFNTQNLNIYDDENGRHTQIHNDSVRWKWTSSGLKKYLNGVESLYLPGPDKGMMLNRGGGSVHQSNPADRTVSGIAAGLAEGWYNVRVVMHWKRDQVNDENGVPRDDPNDNPPKYAWINESAIENGGELGYGWTDTTTNTQHNYDEQNPFAGTQFSFDVSHPFHVSFNGTTPSSADWRIGNLYLGDRYATCIPAEGDYAYGPTRRFHIKITLPASVPGGDITQTVSSNAAMSYTANPATLNVLARLKIDHTPSDLYTDYASSASVVAGHKVTGEHEHDTDLVLQIQETDDQQTQHQQNVYYSHLKGLPGLLVDNKLGVHKGFSILPTDAPAIGYADGSGRIALGIGRSRDRVTSITNHVVIGSNANGSGTNIEHVWDQGNDWTYTAPVILTNQSVQVTFKPVIFGGLNVDGTPRRIPITKHKLNMLVSRVKVIQWNPDTKTQTTKIITTNPNEVDANASPPVELGSTSDYAVFEAPATESVDSPGTYKGKLIVNVPENTTIDQLWFKAQDDEVFAAPTPTQ